MHLRPRTLGAALALALALPAAATVTRTSSRVETTALGAPANIFYFDFPVQNAGDVQVQLNGSIQTSGFTVALNANQASSPGGSVTFSSSPPSGTAVRIQRFLTLTQNLHYSPAAAFPAAAHESALDKLTMGVQQLDRDRADLAARQAADISSEAASRSSADAALNAQIGTQLAAVRGLNGYTTIADSATVLPTGASAADTLANFAGREKWAEDFGAKGDCSTNDQPAIQSGVNWLAANGGGTLRLRQKCYAIDAAISMQTGTYLRGTGGLMQTRIYPRHTNDAAVRIAGTDADHRLYYVGLSDLRIDAGLAQAYPAAHGVYLAHATANITFQNVTVRMVGGRAFYFDGDVFEVHAWNVVVSSAYSGGILIKGTGPGVGAAPWVNDVSFTDLYFVANPPGTRTIEILGACEGNRFVNVSDQSGYLADGGVSVYIEGRWNTLAHYRAYDTVYSGVPLAYVWLNGTTAVRNTFDDVQPYADAGFPLVRFTGGASGNSFHAMDRTGSPQAVYYADASSTVQFIDFKDGSYSVSRRNEMMPGSSEIAYFRGGGGVKESARLMEDLGVWDQSDVGPTDYRLGRYLVGYNESGAPRDRGYPLTLRSDTKDHRTFRFRLVRTGVSSLYPGQLRAVVGVTSQQATANMGAMRAMREGRAVIDGLDASGASSGDPLYVDGATGSLTLTRPDTGFAILAGFVTQPANPAEAYVIPNWQSEIARQARLGMARFTSDPGVGDMNDEETAVGVVGAAGKLYYKSHGIIYVFNAAATIGP